MRTCRQYDSDYPLSLHDFADAPQTLYYEGDISICDEPSIAVIGKRATKERYRNIASRIGKIVSSQNYIVLNGLAIGCDAAALYGALQFHRPVLAVLPCGLDQIYPRQNQNLVKEILKNGGCIVSEYPPYTQIQKQNFIRRDRIQAMLAGKIIVVDSEPDSGTMHTVRFGLSYSKQIGCFAERKYEFTPSGNRNLLENNKAVPIYDTDDLLAFIQQPIYKQEKFTL